MQRLQYTLQTLGVNIIIADSADLYYYYYYQNTFLTFLAYYGAGPHLKPSLFPLIPYSVLLSQAYHSGNTARYPGWCLQARQDETNCLLNDELVGGREAEASA